VQGVTSECMTMQLGTSNVYMKKKLTWKEREKKNKWNSGCRWRGGQCRL